MYNHVLYNKLWLLLIKYVYSFYDSINNIFLNNNKKMNHKIVINMDYIFMVYSFLGLIKTSAWLIACNITTFYLFSEKIIEI